MIKQFLKIAGVKTEKDLLRKYKTEEEFFARHPEAEMLAHAAMGGSYYQDGGSPLYSTQGQALRNFMNTVAYTPGGWMPNHMQLPPVGRYAEGGMSPEDQAMMQQQQGAPSPDQGQGGGGDAQLQEIIKFIVQSLQQGMAPEQIMAKLVEMGVPQDQAGELIQGVVQQLQAQGGGQGPQEEMAEGPQGQEAPPQEMMEGQPPMGRYGGMYANGGAYGNVPQHGNPGVYADGTSGTSSGGQYFDYGGPYIPLYNGGGGNDYRKGGPVKYKKGGEYDMSNQEIQDLIKQGYKIQYI